MLDPSMLMKLLQANPQQVQGLASMAAMKSAPPQLPGPSSPGVLAPGAFAGIMDPSIGQVPQGVQGSAPVMQPPPVPQAGGGGLPFGLDANQAGILSGMSQKQPLHFPGASLPGRAGQVQMQTMAVPQINASHASLAQLLGR